MTLNHSSELLTDDHPPQSLVSSSFNKIYNPVQRPVEETLINMVGVNFLDTASLAHSSRQGYVLHSSLLIKQ
jgi:hypothetical protein